MTAFWRLEKLFWECCVSDTENDSVLPKVSTCLNFSISYSSLQYYESDFFYAISTMAGQCSPCFSVKTIKWKRQSQFQRATWRHYANTVLSINLSQTQNILNKSLISIYTVPCLFLLCRQDQKPLKILRTFLFDVKGHCSQSNRGMTLIPVAAVKCAFSPFCMSCPCGGVHGSCCSMGILFLQTFLLM